MKNGDFLLGAAIGAVIAGCALARAPKPPCNRDEEREEYLPCFCAPPFPCCPCKEKQKKKDPCKGCYYEKYERKCR